MAYICPTVLHNVFISFILHVPFFYSLIYYPLMYKHFLNCLQYGWKKNEKIKYAGITLNVIFIELLTIKALIIGHNLNSIRIFSFEKKLFLTDICCRQETFITDLKVSFLLHQPTNMATQVCLLGKKCNDYDAVKNNVNLLCHTNSG